MVRSFQKIKCTESYGWPPPPEHEYKDMDSNKLLLTFHVTINNITNKIYIFGPDLSGVRGKTVRYNPRRAEME